MPLESVLMLHDGDAPSLVALGMARDMDPQPGLRLLHVVDDHPNARAHRQHARKQAEHFGLNGMIEVHGPKRLDTAGSGDVKTVSGGDSAVLSDPMRLMIAVRQAMRLGVGRVIWPIQSDGDFEGPARATEQALMIRQLVELEGGRPPVVDTPLAELTDREMVEIGAQLDVPWELAWTCCRGGDVPCHECRACRGRRAAFDAAGLVDPMDEISAYRLNIPK